MNHSESEAQVSSVVMTITENSFKVEIQCMAEDLHELLSMENIHSKCE
jgi:hypothetical protein